MIQSQRFKINSPAVINDTIEGESVIINLQNGFYYSLDDIGSVIWNGLINQYSIEEIISAFITRFSEDKERVINEMTELVSELKKESLIVILTEEEQKNIRHDKAFEIEESTLSFAKPVLNKFGDMQDLLLLDPIHEVDEAGWPHSKPEDNKD